MDGGQGFTWSHRSNALRSAFARLDHSPVLVHSVGSGPGFRPFVFQRWDCGDVVFISTVMM